MQVPPTLSAASRDLNGARLQAMILAGGDLHNLCVVGRVPDLTAARLHARLNAQLNTRFPKRFDRL